jgi:predicted RNA-binding protein YlxR (DUF448 family)
MKTLPKKATRRDADENGPLRRCIATGESLPPERLIRFVLSPDGVLTPDLAAELPGRGIWVTANRDALDKAVAGKGFSRAARRQINLPPDLGDQIAALLLRRTMQLLGIARKAGVAITGREKVEAQARNGKIGVLIAASDGAEDGAAKLLRLAKAVNPDIFYVSWLNGTELSLAFGRDNVIHAAIAQGRLADRFVMEAGRLLGFRGKLN